MHGLTATELAGALRVSKARISQLVGDGRLDGCYSGSGRQRRFDLAAAAERLNRDLDRGQLMGNGAATRARLAEILQGEDDAPRAAPQAPDTAPSPRWPDVLDGADPQRYEMARTLKAEEEARRIRRQNLAEEGTWVLAAEVERSVARMMAQEVAQFEVVLREAARLVADRMGVDARTVRKHLVDSWREHRNTRSQDLQAQAETAAPSDAERDADF